jgi:hypothetical protein
MSVVDITTIDKTVTNRHTWGVSMSDAIHAHELVARQHCPSCGGRLELLYSVCLEPECCNTGHMLLCDGEQKCGWSSQESFSSVLDEYEIDWMLKNEAED